MEIILHFPDTDNEAMDTIVRMYITSYMNSHSGRHLDERVRAFIASPDQHDSA